MNEMDAIVQTCLDAMKRAGVKITEREVDGGIEVRYVVPGHVGGRDTHLVSFVPLPETVGRLFHGKFARKFKAAAKRIAKKMAHSKLLKKLGKLAPLLANIIPPPVGEVISVAATAANVAMKIAKAAKRGHKGAMAFLALAKKHKHAAKLSADLADVQKGKPSPAIKAMLSAQSRGNTFEVHTPGGAVVNVDLSNAKVV